jgi:putative ABC transport system permease protein
MKPASNIMDVYVFSVIAIFILFIAIINFVNLTTAKGGKKTKEVGIRKTAGASRSRLVAQFLMESVLQAFFAMIIAGGIIQLLIEPFNQVVQKNLSFSLMHDLWIVPGMLILALLIGILAGIYPSLYLTSFKPAEVLRGTWGGSGKSKTVRNALVILQFSISSFLIVSTVLVYKQMNLLQTFNLGFDKEQVLVIKNGNSLGGSYPLFKEKVLGISGIRTASKSTHLPPGVSNSSLFRPDDGTDDQLLYHYWVDYDHMNALDLKMKAGRFFSEDFPSDSMAIIINQAALDRFGWDDYEGHRILTFLTSTSGGEYVDVIGVVSDFNYASLKEEIQPLAIVLANDGNLISLKMTSDDYSRIIGEIEREWKELSNGAAFDYYFLDEAFDNSYQSEQRMSKIFTLFTLLAIMIACLGLFGLATFTAEQKSKEIGIRKALGATLPNIVLTLSANFLKLVGVAEIIGLIAAYFIMSDWLNEFAYKTAFSLWIFAGSAVLVMLIAFLTITYQAVSVGSAKPSEVLNG